MKAKHILMAMLVLLTGAGVVCGGTNEISTMLQKGLFEEEANRNLEAAIQAYQAVITQTDKDRQFAATAIFRLGECYRKQGKTNEANVQYQRIMREFADQTELVKLSQGYVATPAVKQASTPAELQDGAGQAKLSGYVDPQTKEVERIKALIKDSPDLINAHDELGRTPLNTAISFGQVEVAKFLLENRADIEARWNEMTPLRQAVEKGNREMVDLLLSKGADVNATGLDKTRKFSGLTALHDAARNGHRSIAEALLAHDAKVNVQDSDRQTPFHLAAQGGYKAMAELLLAHGADFSVKDNSGRTALDVAVEAGNRAIVEWLLDNHADVNGDHTTSETPLMRAVQSGRMEIVKILLAHGADVKAQNSGMSNARFKKWTALDLAVALRQGETVKLLLESKANPNEPFHEFIASSKPGSSPLVTTGVTPLMLAVEAYSPEVAQILLEHGAEVNLKDSEGRTALLIAVERTQGGLSGKMMQLLLDRKADPNLTEKTGDTPLHWAISHVSGELQNLELLLAHGAEVNARNDLGQSPLHLAVVQGKKEAVEVLVAHGADVNLKDKKGDAPLDVNMMRGTQAPKEIGEILRQHGAHSEVEFSTIRVTRKGMDSPTIVFRKDVNSRNRFTLFELIANAYGPPTWQPNLPLNHTDLPGLPFPDLSKVQIKHLKDQGGSNIASIDVNGAITAGEYSKDVSLEWGDIVEIPELDHKVTQEWGGLPSQFKEMLTKCVERTVDFVVKGEVTKVTLAPNLPTFSGRISPMRSTSPQAESSRKRLPSFWLDDALSGAQVILASSDLTRVKVKRVDPSTRKTEEMIFNFKQKDSNSNLWLRDGDVIEIPEKQ